MLRGLWNFDGVKPLLLASEVAVLMIGGQYVPRLFRGVPEYRLLSFTRCCEDALLQIVAVVTVVVLEARIDFTGLVHNFCERADSVNL